MSSSNQVRLALIEETTYGETPVAGDFETVRFTSEGLSGSVETSESQQIRTDRLSSGQISTGLTVAGDIAIELAQDTAIDLMIRCAMMQDTWTSDVLVTVDLTIDIAAKTITRVSGDFTSDVVVGDILTLAGFVNVLNNVQVMVTSVDSALIIKYAGPTTVADEVGSGTSFIVSDKVDIGTDTPSVAIEKAFLDLTTKAINYNGWYVNAFTLNVAYGELVTGSFGLVGNGYEPVSAAGDFMTNARTINDPGTSNTMNGSIDMPFIASAATGVFGVEDFCIQSINIDLNNNSTPQNCIGNREPKNYSINTAQVSITISAYLSDNAWSVISKKETQDPFQVGFMVKNAGGYYGFYMPAVQVSFDDPSSPGINQDIILSMDGQAKVGSTGESSLTIYKA